MILCYNVLANYYHYVQYLKNINQILLFSQDKTAEAENKQKNNNNKSLKYHYLGENYIYLVK